jgi:CIC family chloride channel protein
MTEATGLLASPQNFLQNHVFNDYFRKWVFLGVLIGIVAGVGAITFYVAIDASTWLFLEQLVGLTPPGPTGEGETIVDTASRAWLLPLVVAVGGLISGVIVFTLAPEAEGHGTDAAIDAFHEKGGRIRSRIPLIKLVASAVTIGSGGSAGREGPTAQIAAGFGSWLGDVFYLSPADRRTALAVGVGAGIGAIFKAPLGGAILSAEILYVRDFELEALVPGFIASVIGYTIFAAYSGWQPVFGEGLGLSFQDPENLIGFAILGVICGIVGILYVKMFYGTQHLFHGIPIPPHFKPMIAGLLVGGIALVYPEVLSMGYGWIQFAIDGDTQSLAVHTMLVLVLLKIVATSLTIGSGGSGGVFAPGLFIGGMVGGAMWGILDGMVPWIPATPAPYVIVGMVALFGGVAKAPIAVILMVAEMTNEFSMIIPAMLAVTIAYLMTNETRIYISQVDTRADSPAHKSEYLVPLIQSVSVADAMRTNVVTASGSDTITAAEERLIENGIRGMPVLDGGRLIGMFTMTDAFRATREGKTTVEEAMTSSLEVCYPADSIHMALRRMTQIGVSRLPVVSRGDDRELLGLIGTRDVAAALDGQLAMLANNPMAQRMDAGFDPFGSLPVTEAMTTEFDIYPAVTPARQVIDNLTATGSHCAVLVDDDGFLYGIVTLGDIEHMLGEDLTQPAAAAASTKVIFARPTQSLAEAMAQPGGELVRQVPVVEGPRGRMRPVGLLRRGDVLAAFLKARDRQATITRRMLARSGMDDDDLIAVDVSVHRDDFLSGKTLAELDLPQDAVVTSLVRHGKAMIPRGHTTLQPGDQIQIATRVSARDLVLHQVTQNGATAVEAPVQTD